MVGVMDTPGMFTGENATLVDICCSNRGNRVIYSLTAAIFILLLYTLYPYKNCTNQLKCIQGRFCLKGIRKYSVVEYTYVGVLCAYIVEVFNKIYNIAGIPVQLTEEGTVAQFSLK